MKIIAVGKNYAEHALEFDGTVEKPSVPMIFMKPDSAIIKNGKHFYVPARVYRSVLPTVTMMP